MTQWFRDDLVLTDDIAAVDLEFVHSMLASSYWASGRSRDVTEASLARSIPFSVIGAGGQVGFARVVSDHVTFAWIADVVVHPDYRGRGIGTWMVRCILEHPAVAPTLQQLLRTRDAHGLYARFGFLAADCMSRRP